MLFLKNINVPVATSNLELQFENFGNEYFSKLLAYIMML
jgi:hypothetical protein